MKTNLRIVLATLASVLASLVPVSITLSQAASGPPAPALRPSNGQWLNANPKGFIPNVGQLPNEAVKFALRDNGVSAYFTDRGFVLWNGQTAAFSQDGREIEVPIAPRWEIVGAKPVEPVGGKTFDHTVSFFRGNDPAKWHANVPAYRDLRYPEILNGIELRIESRERGFEYSFHVQPYAKPDLRFRYDGIAALEKSLLGDLIVRTASGHFTESRPVSFQLIDGKKREVDSWFEVVSANEYRIAVGPYDERHELVIDPVLDWSTFLGGNYVERLRNVGVDPNGNIVVAGDTYSTDFPATGAFPPGPGLKYDSNLDRWYEDAVVAKFSLEGTHLLWAVYLGGAGLTGDTIGQKGFALNATGDVYLAGFTDSPDFPITGGPAHSGLSDAFVAKIKGDGSALLWSTFLGGSDEDWGTALALDAQENVFVAGLTRSANFPMLNAFDATLGGAQDAFVARFDAAGNRLWSSFLGGGSEERAAAIAADASGNLVLFGDTESSDFPATVGDTTLGGNDDAFVTKLAGDGSGVIWSTFLGGSDKEHELLNWGVSSLNNLLRLKLPRGDMALDSAGNIIVVGHTYSSDFPTTLGAFDRTFSGTNDGYVAKLGANGTLLWSSYLGGSGPADPGGREEIPWGVAVNPWDEIFVIGGSQSTNFPTTSDALKPSQPNSIRYDGFLTKLSADGSTLLYSTYLGGYENNDVAMGVAYNSGNVFVTGWAQASTFPITAGTYQPGCVSCAEAAMGYASDGFVLKFLDAFIAHDGFESGNYSGGSGWAGNWSATGDISILTSSTPHSGARHVRLRSSTGYLQRTVNIPPGSTTVRLGFWAKVNSFEGSDQALVLAKSTGASFTPVASFTSAQGDNQYHYYEIDLTSFLPATQIQIAFDAAMNANNDNWYLDDIRVTGTSVPVPPVANAGADQTATDTDNSGTETVTLNGLASFDPDGGGIVSYEWKEGATVLGTGVSLNTSLSVGVHTITLTVTDDESATASDTVQVTVNAPPPPPANPLHSGDLDGSSVNSGKYWKATVVVTMHNGSHSPVAGAAVSIQWTGGFSGTASATTDANGRCTFISGNISKQSSSAMLTITSVTHATLTYSAAANHDPDSDSNGTSITVNKP